MEKKKALELVISLIRKFGLEDEVASELNRVDNSVIGEKVSSSQKTSNGYEIYYDNSNGEAVGIVYKNLVFLKKTSQKKLDWYEAVEYCKTVIVNGIESQLCPADEDWREEFREIVKDLYEALHEIGAENLDDYTWSASVYNNSLAREQNLSDGSMSLDYKFKDNYVRPVLDLEW